ncbi:Cytochrome c oxidase, subunit VIb [Sesbania bispinosa]|nr:Cytochrome c oxidase, subunit VIb [Sesbania bispinosa]
MADKSTTLAEQYFVTEKQEKTDTNANPAEVKEVENPKEAASEEAAVDKTVEETPATAEESSEVISPTDQSTDPTSDAITEESSGNAEEENVGGQDEAADTPEIKLETAPADFRFPTTNQTRHCFTRYIEYHRCVAAKGEGAPECEKFAKYYRSLCPGEWLSSLSSAPCLIVSTHQFLWLIHSDAVHSEM